MLIKLKKNIDTFTAQCPYCGKMLRLSHNPRDVMPSGYGYRGDVFPWYDENFEGCEHRSGFDEKDEDYFMYFKQRLDI